MISLGARFLLDEYRAVFAVNVTSPRIGAATTRSPIRNLPSCDPRDQAMRRDRLMQHTPSRRLSWSEANVDANPADPAVILDAVDRLVACPRERQALVFKVVVERL